VAAGNEGFYNGMNASWTAAVTVVAAAGSAQATLPLSMTISISNPSFAPEASAINLPIVKIDTGGVGIVDKTTDVPGTITITSADGQTPLLPSTTNADNTATFHLHSNSTLGMPKVPYHVKLTTKMDLLSVMGLSCPYVSKGQPICDKSKSYVLLANYDDKTFLRDWSASALANAIPMGGDYLSSATGSPSPSGNATLMPWAPHSLFVELFVNGVYEGNYQLIEQVKVDTNRVNISELAETDVTDDITGGYLLEIDQHRDEAFVFTTPQGLPIGLIDPDFTPDPEVPQQTAYISDDVNQADAALYSSNFTDPTTGWRAYFDEASAVNFYIVNDLMGNNDGGAMWSSDYLYKSKDNALLYMGPIWDFDISSGNDDMNVIANPTVPWMQNAPWYSQWFKDPGFKADVTTQWNALQKNGVLSTWISSIQQQAQALEQSQANNFGRWPMQGVEVWPNVEAVGSYDGEVQYLTTWLQLRLAYLDSQFNNKAQTTTTLSVPTGTLRNGTPVKLTAQVTGGTSPSGVVSFLSSGILLGTGSLSSGVASLTTSSLPSGTDLLQAVYNGDTPNGLSASDPQSVVAAAAPVAVTVSLGGPSTAQFGISDTYTASVIPSSGVGVPTGTVTFAVDGVSATGVTLDGTAVATYSTNSLAAVAHVITASYAGDNSYGAASSQSVQVQIGVATPTLAVSLSAPTITTVQPLTVTVAVTGATGSPAPTGTVTLTAGDYTSVATALASGITTINVPAGCLATGTESLTVSYSGDLNYSTTTASTSVAVTLPISAVPTMVVSLSAPTITTAQALTVTVAVTGGPGNPAPAGTVALTGGNYTSAAIALARGSATINVPAGSLATGTDSLTVSYSGDLNYSTTTASTSVMVTIPIRAGFTISGATVTVNPGATSANTSTITVAPVGGFTGTVVLTAAITSSPAGALYPPTLSFASTSPVSITGSDAGTATLTITTTPATSAALIRSRDRGVPWHAAVGATLACILLFGLPVRRRRWRSMLGMLALIVVLGGGMLACGGTKSTSAGTSNPGTSAGTYALTVTGTSGTITTAATVTLVVQ
jgi:hypothetical protein